MPGTISFECCIIGCDMTYYGNPQHMTFHKFPEDEELKKKWFDSLGTENIDYTQQNLYVCNSHFRDQGPDSSENAGVKIPTLKPWLEPRVDDSFYMEASNEQHNDRSNDMDVQTYVDASTSTRDRPPPEPIHQTTSSSMDVDTSSDSDDSDGGLSVRILQHPDLSTDGQCSHSGAQAMKTVCSRQRKHIKRISERCIEQRKKIASWVSLYNTFKERDMLYREGKTIEEMYAGFAQYFQERVAAITQPNNDPGTNNDN